MPVGDVCFTLTQMAVLHADPDGDAWVILPTRAALQVLGQLLAVCFLVQAQYTAR